MTAPTAERIDTLPESGRYIVDTLTSTYHVDVDARTVVGVDMRDGSDMWPVPFMFDRVECRVGARMLLDAFLLGDRDGMVATSLVIGITRDEAGQ